MSLTEQQKIGSILCNVDQNQFDLQPPPVGRKVEASTHGEIRSASMVCEKTMNEGSIPQLLGLPAVPPRSWNAKNASHVQHTE